MYINTYISTYIHPRIVILTLKDMSDRIHKLIPILIIDLMRCNAAIHHMYNNVHLSKLT